MKKLLILMVLVLAVGGAAAYFFFSSEANHEEIPFAECETEAIGLWCAANDSKEPVIINKNHTARILGEDMTWQVTYSSLPGGGINYKHFTVHFYDALNQDKYNISFKHKPDNDLWVCGNICYVDENGKRYPMHEGDIFDRFKDGTVEMIELNADNWADYFEIKHFLEGYQSGPQNSWTYYAYICLKPEYARRALQTGFEMGLYYDIVAHPYTYTLDPESSSISLGDIHPDGKVETLCEPVYLKIKNLAPKYREDYLLLGTIHTSRDYWGEQYVNIADDIFIGNANGVLVLAK